MTTTPDRKQAGRVIGVLITLILAVVLGAIEGIPLYRKKMWKEFAALISLLIIALSLEMAKVLDLPTPIKLLEDLLSPIGRSILRYE